MLASHTVRCWLHPSRPGDWLYVMFSWWSLWPRDITEMWSRRLVIPQCRQLISLEVFIPARQFVRRNVHVFGITVKVTKINRTFNLQTDTDLSRFIYSVKGAAVDQWIGGSANQQLRRWTLHDLGNLHGSVISASGQNCSTVPQIFTLHGHIRALNPLKGRGVTHPGLTYIINFWHSGTLALSPERQSARMSEIKM